MKVIILFILCSLMSFSGYSSSPDEMEVNLRIERGLDQLAKNESFMGLLDVIAGSLERTNQRLEQKMELKKQQEREHQELYGYINDDERSECIELPVELLVCEEEGECLLDEESSATSIQ